VSRFLPDGVSLTTPRLQIRRASVEDVASMPWLAAALLPEATLEDLRPSVEAGWAAVVSRPDGERLGLAAVRADEPARGAASVPFIGVDPRARFRGLGGEAGLAIDRHLRRSLGFGKVYAPVPEGRGLAVYFWLRLGFRPVLASRAPPMRGLSPERLSGIWLLRDAD
jgi:GNAT superfamily N-acetyltransferase